jgi:hypothetical protein
VILPPKKNYIPQFLKQRDINSYFKPDIREGGEQGGGIGGWTAVLTLQGR